MFKTFYNHLWAGGPCDKSNQHFLGKFLGGKAPCLE